MQPLSGAQFGPGQNPPAKRAYAPTGPHLLGMNRNIQDPMTANIGLGFAGDVMAKSRVSNPGFGAVVKSGFQAATSQA